jgi:hypothetical protein
MPGPIRFVLTTPALERTIMRIVESNQEWRDRVSIVHLSVAPS